MKKFLLAFGLALAMSASAMAAPFSIMIGDNDGYGFGVPDNHSGAPFWPGPPYDGRSVLEAAATNGAQVTDVYAALFPAFGPNPTSTVQLVFALPGQLTSGTFTIDVADLQLQPGGVTVSFNGVNQPGLLPNQGFMNSGVLSFNLTAAQIANANLAGQFVVDITRNGGSGGDFVAFDFFQFNGDAQVPEPASMLAWSLIVGVGAVGYRMRKRRAQPVAV